MTCGYVLRGGIWGRRRPLCVRGRRVPGCERSTDRGGTGHGRARTGPRTTAEKATDGAGGSGMQTAPTRIPALTCLFRMPARRRRRLRHRLRGRPVAWSRPGVAVHGVGGEVPDSVARKCAGFGASEGSCNPVKVTLPELPIEGGILRTQAGQLDLNICAVTRRGERDLNECRCRRRCVGSLTVPSNHQAVRGIDFDVAADDHRPVEVKVERVPRLRSRHEVSSALTRAAHVREAQAVRAG